MAISYNYEVVSVNTDAGVMEVVYTADGYTTQHIGARLPLESETLESIIEMYSPVGLWEEENAVRISVAVGTAGSIVNEDPVPDPAAVIRAERDALLAGTDIYGLSDMTMTPEMIAYRQALRDITDQATFPDSVDWPIAP